MKGTGLEDGRDLWQSWRRVVASPKPKKIVEIHTILPMLSAMGMWLLREADAAFP